MTQEQKYKLLKYLCMALPYGVKAQIIKNLHLGVFTLYPSDIDKLKLGTADIKPYLRPMSSMTEEEKKEYELLANRTIVTSVGFVHLEATELIEWLLKKHFDFMGFIDKGPAIEVTEDNNPYKD